MGRYLLGRLLTVPPTLLGVSIVIFRLLRHSPGDPAMRILSEEATRRRSPRCASGKRPQRRAQAL